MLICMKAYANEADHKRLYCSDSGELCAHQYWCDMALKWKNTNQAEGCPGKEKNDEKRKNTRKTNKVNSDSVPDKGRK